MLTPPITQLTLSEPSPVHKFVKAFAPATVANLGPGFDFLGCAVDGLGDYVTAEVHMYVLFLSLMNHSLCLVHKLGAVVISLNHMTDCFITLLNLSSSNLVESCKKAKVSL